MSHSEEYRRGYVAGCQRVFSPIYAIVQRHVELDSDEWPIVHELLHQLKRLKVECEDRHGEVGN